MRTLALLLALAALPALAEESKPAPERKQERRPLNLKLDNPGSWATVAPSTAPKDPKSGLPTLGDDARTMPTEVRRTETGTVYPKDSEFGAR